MGSNRSALTQPFTVKSGRRGWELLLSSPQPEAGADAGTWSPYTPPGSVPPYQSVSSPTPPSLVPCWQCYPAPTCLATTCPAQHSVSSGHGPAAGWEGDMTPVLECGVRCLGVPQLSRCWLPARQSRGNTLGVLGSACSTALPPVKPSTLASPRHASLLRHHRVQPRVGAGRWARKYSVPAWAVHILGGGGSASFGPRGGGGTEEQGPGWPFLLLRVSHPAISLQHSPGAQRRGPGNPSTNCGVPTCHHAMSGSPPSATTSTAALAITQLPLHPVSPVGCISPQPAAPHLP